VDASQSDPPMPCARAAARAAYRREQEKASHKERRIRWQEHREQQDEEYRLREQHGLSPLVTQRTRRQEKRKKRRAMRGGVGGNRARRWMPTQQPLESSTLLRKGYGRRPSSETGRAYLLTTSITTF
jgi:hypothetical protein